VTNSVVRDTLPDRLLNIADAAAYLHCCRATVLREVARGRLRGQKVGNRWRFAPEDLRAYLVRGDDWSALVEQNVKKAPRLAPWQVQRLTALFDYQPPTGERPLRD
jgi:excisionase family DNA binding protein